MKDFENKLRESNRPEALKEHAKELHNGMDSLLKHYGKKGLYKIRSKAGLRAGVVRRRKARERDKATKATVEVRGLSRNDRIRAWRKAGRTLEAIGKDENISHQRVVQIVQEGGDNSLS